MRRPSRTSWRIANGFMLLSFVFSAAVQVNDPDWFRWIAIYLAAGVVCGREIAAGAPWWAATFVGVGALAGAAIRAPRVLGSVPFRDMFGAWEMQHMGIEESREMYGLLVVAAWMLAVTFVALRRARAEKRDAELANPSS